LKSVKTSLFAIGSIVALIGFLASPSMAMAATTSSVPSNTAILSPLLPGQSESSTISNAAGVTTYVIHRLTSEEVAQGVQDGLIPPANVTAPSSTSCTITLNEILTHTVKAAVGSYTTDDDIVWQFQNPSGNDTKVDTAAPGQDATYPYHTTTAATAVWDSNYADAVGNFDFLNTKHGTLSDFSTFFNVTFSGSSWAWEFFDGLNSNKDTSGSDGIDGPWVCS